MSFLNDVRELRRVTPVRERLLQQQRYGVAHRRLRSSLAPFVASGLAVCARCGETIAPGEPWDLGHDDYDPSGYSGPEHTACNRGAPNRNQTSRVW